MPRLSPTILAALLLIAPTWVVAQNAKPEDYAKTARPSIYDPTKNADEQIAQATAKARRDGKRVLVMFGGDWCGWCHKLNDLFRTDPATRTALNSEYVLAKVDTKAPGAEALLERCRGPVEQVSYPFLAVLDGDGKVVTQQKTDPLEEGDHHDPAKVRAFLKQWEAPRVEAAAALDAALAKAASEDKRVFLHFGAEWCGWCHKLEDFTARPEVASILGRDFVDLKIDTERMPGAADILARYNKEGQGGIPWFAFLDAKGHALATSNGPKGNIGYPAAPEEVAHFVAMLNQTRRRIEPAQVEAIEQALRAEAKALGH